MKRILLNVAFVVFTVVASAQAPAIEWEKNIGGTAGEGMNSLEQTTDGGYIIGGFTYSADHDVTANLGQNDLWIVKMTSAGVIEWQKTIGGSSFEFNPKVGQTTDGGYILAGTTQSTNGDALGNHGMTDIIVVKLNAAGVVQWRKMLGGSNEETLGNVSETADGGFVVAGNTKSNDGDVTNLHGSSDRWVVKLNSVGVIDWQKTYGGTLIDGGSAVYQTADGGYISTGTSRSSNGDATFNYGNDDFWVVKTNATGVIEWQKSLGGSAAEGYADLRIAPNGGYILSGMTMSNNGLVSGNHGDSDVWLVKLSDAGTVEWQKTFGGSGTDGTYSVAADANGGFMFAGYTNSVNGDITAPLGDYDIWVVKLNATGTIVWQKNFGGSDYELGYAIAETADNGYVFLGGTNSSDNNVTTNYGNYDGWVVKLVTDALGANNIPNQNFTFYPNPATSQLNLVVPENSIISAIRIYDLTGKKVNDIQGDIRTLNIGHLSQGTYIIEVIAGTSVFTGKFIKQ